MTSILNSKNGLVVENTPNAVGVLFRVFLEGTLNLYAKKYSLYELIENRHPLIGMKLRIREVIKHLENEKGIERDRLDKIRIN